MFGEDDKKMYIYLLKRPKSKPADYDEYIGAVVIATDEATAITIHPDGKNMFKPWNTNQKSTWIDPRDVVVERIGVAEEDRQRVLLTDFRAG